MRLVPKSILVFLVVIAVTLSSHQVGAVSGTTLSVSPLVNGGVPGNPPFDVSIQVANVTDLISYDITLQWDPNIVSAVGINDSGTLFSSQPHVPLLVTTGLGFARIAETLLGTSASASGSSSQPLVFITLSFVGFGTSQLQISDDTLVDVSINAIPHLDINGVVQTPPPASATFVHWKSRPDFKHLNTTQHGMVDTFFADVREGTGASQAYVRVIFTVVASTGDTTSATTSIVLLAPGQESILSASWKPPATLSFRYFVMAQLQVSGDGSQFSNGSSKTFSFTVTT